jgi:hypothetical protein
MRGRDLRHVSALRVVVVDHVAMIDEQLSAALIAYLGVPGRLDQSPEARLVEAAGDSAPDLMPRITASLDQCYEEEKSSFWQAGTVAEMGRAVDEWLRANHAELSDDAIRAVANRFTFDNK